MRHLRVVRREGLGHENVHAHWSQQLGRFFVAKEWFMPAHQPRLCTVCKYHVKAVGVLLIELSRSGHVLRTLARYLLREDSKALGALVRELDFGCTSRARSVFGY